MKQIEYNEKQKIVLEVINDFIEKFHDEYRYSRDISKFHKRINEIKSKYGIIDKYKTLREYISENECGAYHEFQFKIDDCVSVKTRGIDEFENIYNKKWLDMYYVLNDKSSDNDGNCENYLCVHVLEIVLKED